MTAPMLWLSVIAGLCSGLLMAAYLMPRLIR